jgi:hypothetical protein
MNRTFMQVEKAVKKHGSLLASVDKHASRTPGTTKRTKPWRCQFTTQRGCDLACVLEYSHDGACSWETM